LGRNNGDKAGGLSIGLAEIASGKCLLLSGDHIIPNNLTMPEKLPLYLGFFEFVHNVRKRGKALLPALIELLVT